jgi:hypothetical protein
MTPHLDKDELCPITSCSWGRDLSGNRKTRKAQLNEARIFEHVSDTWTLIQILL